MLKNLLKKILTFFTVDISLKIHRLCNKNKRFSIISNNCVGGLLYQQYGMKYYSPTIGLGIDINEFVYFCNNLNYYLGLELKYLNTAEKYPVGILLSQKKDLPNIRINFIHYSSFEEAYEKWERRKKRVDYDKLFVVCCCYDPDSVSKANGDTVTEFNRIKYKKVIFVKNTMGFSDEQYLYEGKSVFKVVSYSWKRYFNKFNFDSFFRKTN